MSCCAEHRAAEEVRGFPLDAIVRRYRRDHGVGARKADSHLRELQRYLLLAATAEPGRCYPMFGPADGIDGVWHTFLLFTRQYGEYCARLGRYVHHQPADEGADPDGPTDDDYQEFLDRYLEVFGEVAPSDLWPRFISWDDLLGTYDVPAKAGSTRGG